MSSNIIAVDSAAAFGPFGKAGIPMPARDYAPEAPYMPTANPHYIFRDSMFMPLKYVWAREHGRQPHQSRLGVLFMGPKGCGKTTGAEQFWQRLGVPVPSMTANKRTTVQDLLGGKTLSGGEVMYDNGPLVFAMENGLPFILNEMDLMDPGELTGLNDIIERGVAYRDNGDVITARVGFIFNATMNTRGSGDVDGAYSATNVMNKALMSRFLKVWVDYPTKEEEADILRFAIPNLLQPEATRFVEVANLIRKGYSNPVAGAPPLEETMSTRELISWVELVAALREKHPNGAQQMAMELVLTNACEKTTREAIKLLVKKVFPMA